MTEPVNDSIQNELSNQDSNQSNLNNATGSNRNANSFRNKQNRQQHNNNNNRPNNRSNYNNNFNNYNNNNQRYSNNSYNQYYNQQNDFFPIDQNNQNNNFNYSNQSNNSAKRSNSRQEMNSNLKQAFSNHRSNNRYKKKNTSRSNYNQNDEPNNNQQELNNEQKIFNRTNSNQQEASNKKNRPHSNQQQQQQQQKKPKEPQPIETRSEILIDQLMKFNLECMVCCHKIRDDKSIWSCNVCYHIFHLYCIKKWANSPAAKVVEDDLNKWRCPGCQTTHQQIPSKYTCFCGKKINPDLNKQDENKPFHLRQVPHSCGQICGKSLANTNNLMCKHTCVALCHPGPCQPCEALVNRMCNCSNAKFQVKCSSNKQPICEKKCEKLLNCLKHNCGQICHANECQSCQIDIEQECYSHQTKNTAKCGSASKYSCSQKCNKLLKCGKHYCDQECHDGDCPTCPLLPSKLLNCPCGKTAIKELLIKNKIIRTSCTDPIPVCTKTCNKLLHSCGDAESDLHFCEAKCHLNECPPCLKQIEIKCRCGKESESVQCFQKPQVKLCNRRCFKKKFCGRHQCNEICCNDKDHLCTIVCNRQLDCGSHKCELLCHKGPCQRCLIASFEERICDCGQTVQYPPIRCGTKPIECNKPCAREHDCLHPINHNCHWEPNCPPCSYLTSKMCMGQHELRHNIPCFMKDISCGRLCGKQLPNCSHKCNKSKICIRLI
jgi:transcriptional repressor NF-X1